MAHHYSRNCAKPESFFILKVLIEEEEHEALSCTFVLFILVSLEHLYSHVNECMQYKMN